MTSYRCLFGAAALQGIVAGLWLVLAPESLSALFAADPLTTVIGTVLALCGVGYALVALRPEHGTWLVTVGLAVKVLVPIGWLVAVAPGELSTRLFPLILLDDLIWWFPFLFYLVRELPARRTIITWVGVILHGLASLALLGVAGGTEIVTEMADRANWVAVHKPAWAVTWTLWAGASMSFLAFVMVWSEHLVECGVPRAWAVAGCLICAVGVVIDLVGETVNLAGSTQPDLTVSEFGRVARLYDVLSAGTANGLYCVGGLLLSCLAWRAGALGGPLLVLGLAMWAMGLALTVAVALDQGPAMIVTGASVMLLYIPWAALLGWRMRSASCRMEATTR